MAGFGRLMTQMSTFVRLNNCFCYTLFRLLSACVRPHLDQFATQKPYSDSLLHFIERRGQDYTWRPVRSASRYWGVRLLGDEGRWGTHMTTTNPHICGAPSQPHTPS